MSYSPAISESTISNPLETAPEGYSRIALHNPELTAHLGKLFDEHFREARRPSFRVRINHLLKRLLDIMVSALGLALLWPVLLVSAIATFCDTGLPIHYSQIRRIRFGRRARIYKMRTLVKGADRNLNALVDIKTNGRFLNIAKAESSYTRVGRVLERLWIVELPQLWNVLRGQMSLVGNRPIPDYVIGVLGVTHEVAERFASPQGLTGYTQIIGRDNVTDEERIHLEYRYSQIFEEGNIFFEDLRIIFLTIMAYLGLGSPRRVRDFLSATYQNSGSLTAEHNEHDRVGIAETQIAGREVDLQREIFTCPTCYEITTSCDSGACQKECITSCGHDAIRLEGEKPVILKNCISCSACAVACPQRAIDKVSLKPDDEALVCSCCGERYQKKEGVFDFLPRSKNLEQNPYFEFYEAEYMQDNPMMHLEDTEWKLGELIPLLKGHNGLYRNLLDLGCGAGVLSGRIAEEMGIKQHTAADCSTQILSFARGNNNKGTFVRLDAAYLPFRNSSYDMAMLIDVIEHQHKPKQVLLELRRVSRALLMRTPLEDCWYESARRRRKDLFRESSGHVLHFNLNTVSSYLEKHGWQPRRQSIRHISWSHWRSVIGGDYPRSAKLTAAARLALRWLLPSFLYRRLFVMNYNAFCEPRLAK